MVCPRCIMSVEQLLKDNNMLSYVVCLGEVELKDLPTPQQLSRFSQDLLRVGFELLDDAKTQQIEKIKNLLIEQAQKGIEEHFSVTKFLSANIFKDYSSLSKLFSEVEGITIEQFFILQKIEKAKELLMYDEAPLSDIAFKLGYSSSQHLSAQFKKITGMTPTKFKSLGNFNRKSIDSLNKPA